ncbi:MAG: hypothetical protein A3B70_02395 [Deltaproteobacteria bacterium RIFCSPHIGHO2_02_FULL_40_11]|nr:MAG: hypothetical protein A3B70_02395 [Deltaproteobacteria bacterium RIFCSPHIGHO2_02_FULL_40_11]
MKHYLKLYLILTVFLWGYPALYAEGSPKDALEKMTELVQSHIVPDSKKRDVAAKDPSRFQTYRQQNEKFHSEISKYMDFELLAELSMPKKWQEKYWKNERSKKEFVDILKQLVEEIVYPRGKDFFDEVNLKYKKEVPLKEKNRVSLTCTAAIKGKEGKSVNVEYHLIQKGDTWKIYDINLEGDWWTESFKGQFNHVITTKSYDDLVSLMQKKLERVKKGTAF